MKIGPREAKRAVLISIVGSGVLVVVDHARTGEWPDPSLFVGLAMTYIMLGFGSDLAPTVAGPLAILFFLAVLLTRGKFVIDAVDKMTGGKSKAKPNLTVVGGKKKKTIPTTGSAVKGRGS